MTENHEHDHGHDHGHGHEASRSRARLHPRDRRLQDEIVECRVMPGSMVVKSEAEAAGLFRDYEGKRYWFCCAACGPLWDADPAKYANA